MHSEQTELFCCMEWIEYEHRNSQDQTYNSAEDLGGVTGKQLQRVKSLLMELCDSAGLVDDTKLFTHEEFKKRNANMPSHAQLHDRIFRTMFRGLDINGDGVVSIDEWELHYKCMGIDPKHAKASFEAMDTIRDNVVSGEDFLA